MNNARRPPVAVCHAQQVFGLLRLPASLTITDDTRISVQCHVASVDQSGRFKFLSCDPLEETEHMVLIFEYELGLERTIPSTCKATRSSAISTTQLTTDKLDGNPQPHACNTCKTSNGANTATKTRTGGNPLSEINASMFLPTLFLAKFGN